MSIRPLLLLSMLFASSQARADYGQVDLPLGPNGEMSTLHYYRFSDQTHSLKVIDQGNAAPRYRNLEAAMRANGCVAGCNGSTLTRENKPFGMVIADGRVTGEFTTNSPFSSGVLYVENNRTHLARSTALANKVPLPRQLVQSGPLLIENGKVNPELKEVRFSRRSVIATDGRQNWVLIYSPPTTLSQLAQTLAKPNAIPGLTLQSALNLGGGTSSSLWSRRTNNALYFREAAPLPHFIGINQR